VRPTVGQISTLTQAAQARLERLQTLSYALRSPLAPQDHRILSYVIIESANLWAQYSQCLFLSSALGALDRTGTRIVTTPVMNPSQAIDLAVHAVRPQLRGIQRPWKSHELPDFQNKGHLAQTLSYIGASIYEDVDRAVSYPTRVLLDLPTMRNFYAHKAERAARKASALGSHYGLNRPMSPPLLLCTPPAGRVDILVVEWLADLAAILSLMP